LIPNQLNALILFKNLNKIQILGIGLILLSYIFWGLIFLIPFLKLGLKTSSIAITILFIGSNIFWLGIFLAGKELMLKLKILQKIKNRLTKNSSTDTIKTSGD
jgi:hypothetical protein